MSGGVQSVGGNRSGGTVSISADGRYLAGENLDGTGGRYAARYDFNTSAWTLAPHPSGFGNVGANRQSSWGMDDSGNVLAIAAYDSGARYKPVTYDFSTSTFGFNPSQGATFHARPNDISNDGSTIVGWDQVSGRNAAVWRNGVQVYFDAGVPGEVNGVNSNGTMFFGFRSNQPVYWNSAFAPTTLPLLSGFDRGAVASGSDDGSLMVGYLQTGVSTGTRRAVVWVNGSPMLLSDWAAARGMKPASNLVGTATKVTPDGNTIIGWRLDVTQKGFVMHNAVPKPTTMTVLGVAALGTLLRRRRKQA